MVPVTHRHADMDKQQTDGNTTIELTETNGTQSEPLTDEGKQDFRPTADFHCILGSDHERTVRVVLRIDVQAKTSASDDIHGEGFKQSAKAQKVYKSIKKKK